MTAPDVDLSLAAGEPEEAARRLLAFARTQIAPLPDDSPQRARWALCVDAMEALIKRFDELHTTPERSE